MKETDLPQANRLNLFGRLFDKCRNRPRRSVMNHSLHSADRATHLKIVVVALIAATMVAGIGVAARVTGQSTGDGVQRIEASVPVKAGGPITVSSSGARAIR